MFFLLLAKHPGFMIIEPIDNGVTPPMKCRVGLVLKNLLFLMFFLVVLCFSFVFGYVF